MNVGNTAEAMGQAGAETLKATYDFAIHTHGSIGPSCAVAEFKDGKLTSWSASQATHNLRKQLATMFAMPANNVRCIYIEGSGCYGRNGHEDVAADAALLAKTVERPVRVQWSRADEHGWDPKGPPTLIDIRAAVDDWPSEAQLLPVCHCAVVGHCKAQAVSAPPTTAWASGPPRTLASTSTPGGPTFTPSPAYDPGPMFGGKHVYFAAT